MSQWVVIGVYRGRFVAEMMSELLRNEGIPSFVAVDDAGGLRPDLGFTLGAKLRVHAEDEERAKRILEHHGDPEDF